MATEKYTGFTVSRSLIDIDRTQVSDAATRQMDELRSTNVRLSDPKSTYHPLKWEDSFVAIYNHFKQNGGVKTAAEMLQVPEKDLKLEPCAAFYHSLLERFKVTSESTCVINFYNDDLTFENGIPEFDAEPFRVVLRPGDVLYMNAGIRVKYKARKERKGGPCIVVVFKKYKKPNRYDADDL